MSRRLPAQRILEIQSQDQLAFCLQIAGELRHTIDVNNGNSLDLERIRRYLFVNKGWRLTRNGADVISANYKHYTSINENNKILTGKILLNLDHCIGGPWFLRGNSISVFDSQVHFEIQMVNGNINDFVDLKSSR